MDVADGWATNKFRLDSTVKIPDVAVHGCQTIQTHLGDDLDGCRQPWQGQLCEGGRPEGEAHQPHIAKACVDRQRVAQIIAREWPSFGAVAARSLDVLWQCDLIDFPQLPKDHTDG